jgi:hypothetical protein
MSKLEQYRTERAEARACGDRDFPTFNEWKRTSRQVREDAEWRIAQNDRD